MPSLVGKKELSTEEVKIGQEALNKAKENRQIVGKERTGAQILAQPLAGGILFPQYYDESVIPYGEILGPYADMPGCPFGDISSLPNNNLGSTEWDYFYGRRALWYRRIRMMRRDPTINLVRILSIAPILAAGWTVEETEEAKKWPEAKTFVEKEIEPFRLTLINKGMQGCLDFGWQSNEKVFEYLEKDNKIHIKKIKALLPDLTHIRVNPNTGEFIGLQQFQNFTTYQTNTIVNLDYDESLLYYIDEEGTNWYGNSVMRIAEMPHRFGLICNNAAMKYDLKVAGSHWVVSYPIGTSPDIQTGQEVPNEVIAQRIINNLDQCGAVALPTMIASYVSDLDSIGGEFAAEKRDWKVELMSDSGNASSHFDTRMRYLDSLKARAFGFPERSVLEGQFGTKAEAGEHGDFALTHIMFRGDMFCQQTNKGLINQLLRYNYGEEAEGCVYIKQRPLTDEKRAMFLQLYMKLLDLPSTEPQEVAGIDFNALKKKLDIPVIEETSEDDQDQEVEAPVDQTHSLQDVLSSVNQNYNYMMMKPTNNNSMNPYQEFDHDALQKRIQGEMNNGNTVPEFESKIKNRLNKNKLQTAAKEVSESYQ
ncbi:MAG TPA: hypothetical protein VFQ86_13360 [Arachidicoccus soli]|nr:hypothetical protein [Arachidicoccus soli]